MAVRSIERHEEEILRKRGGIYRLVRCGLASHSQTNTDGSAVLHRIRCKFWFLTVKGAMLVDDRLVNSVSSWRFKLLESGDPKSTGSKLNSIRACRDACWRSIATPSVVL